MAGAAAGERTLKPCDLVMKGGITSGVVYPAAMKRLSRDYVFRRIGGASARAIAAVICAACEFRRRAHPGADAFAALDTVNAELTQAHFIERLFQPTLGARPAFEAALALQAGKVGPALRAVLRSCRSCRTGCCPRATPSPASPAPRCHPRARATCSASRPRGPRPSR